MSDDQGRFHLEDDDSVEQEQTPDDYASPERFEADKERYVDFLQDPRNKRTLTEFLEDTYKGYEQEAVDRAISRTIHQHESELQGATPFHKPGHIGPLMWEFLNMVGVESSFISGLQHTKSSMTKTIQQRVDEINTLLRGVGGFNRQIKASFSRSAVVYLEQEDPENTHRENVIFTINLADFELRYPMDESAENEVTEDGRTFRRMIWDEAVNTLCEIVSNTGMKPKFVKNDKGSCIFSIKQYLLSKHDDSPDEYFTFDLRHVNDKAREQMTDEYLSTIERYDRRIARCEKKMRSVFATKNGIEVLVHDMKKLERERDFYVATNPDPRHIDSGLLFSIKVNTLKDYTITKDKMQVIMTKYILALSNIAVDKSMDQQVNTVYHKGQPRPKDFQSIKVPEPATIPKDEPNLRPVPPKPKASSQPVKKKRRFSA